MSNLRRRVAVALFTLAAVALGAAPAHADEPRTGLKAEYFDYTDLTGKLAERIDQTIDFDWDQTEPVPGVGEDFSARWTGIITPQFSEKYTFITRSDDGVRLWVGDELIVDDWELHPAAHRQGQIELEAGKAYDIKIEYFDGKKHAVMRLEWKSASLTREVVPAAALAPERPADPPSVDIPEDGGVTAVVEPAGQDPLAPLPVPEPLPDNAPIPVDAPGIVSSGGPLAPPAPPVAGETFNAEPEGGEVLVRRPADGQLVPLEAGASLPVGTHVDARYGGVDLQTAPAVGFDGKTQDAHFEGGMFKVGQGKRGNRLVTIDLMHGEFSETCGPLSRADRRAMRRGLKARAASAPTAHAAGARNTRVLRRLWGKGKGRFRTRGRHAAATVRGTSWSLADRCYETAVRVHEGVVDVENLLTGETVTLRAGERYSARG